MEVIKWTIYIILAGLAILVWAVVAQKKKEKNKS